MVDNHVDLSDRNVDLLYISVQNIGHFVFLVFVLVKRPSKFGGTNKVGMISTQNNKMGAILKKKMSTWKMIMLTCQIFVDFSEKYDVNYKLTQYSWYKLDINKFSHWISKPWTSDKSIWQVCTIIWQVVAELCHHRFNQSSLNTKCFWFRHIELFIYHIPYIILYW